MTETQQDTFVTLGFLVGSPLFLSRSHLFIEYCAFPVAKDECPARAVSHLASL
jgi:hypothetical protein